MVRSRVIALVLLGILLAAFAAAWIWYYTPTALLRRVDADEVDVIKVFDGTEGGTFVITEQEDIRAIVEGIQGVRVQRAGRSSNHDGFSYALGFMGKDGKALDELILNGSLVARRDPFFYEPCEDGSFPFQSLSILRLYHRM